MTRRLPRNFLPLASLAAVACFLAACADPEPTGAASFWGKPGAEKTVRVEDLGERPRRGGAPESLWPSGNTEDSASGSHYRVWKNDWRDKPE